MYSNIEGKAYPSKSNGEYLITDDINGQCQWGKTVLCEYICICEGCIMYFVIHNLNSIM